MKRVVRQRSIKRVLVAIAAMASLAAFAGPEVSQAVVQFTPLDRLYSVAFDGDYGEAVGESGLVVESTDGGKTWRHEVTPPTPLAIFSVAINGDRTIAVGQLGLILVRDGRKAWRKVESPAPDRRLMRVSFNKSGLGVAVGAFGTLLKTTDRGDTWSELKPDWANIYKTDSTSDFSVARDEPTLYVAKVFDDGSIVIGGEYGQLNRSTDGGQSWTAVYKATVVKVDSNPPTVFGMQFLDDGHGYAAGQDGLIVTTADGGKTWNKLESNSQASLFDVAGTGDGHVFAIGMRSGLVSSDSGKTWQPLKALDLSLNWYSGLGRGTSTAGDMIVAVGHSGRVLNLVAGGASSN